MSWYRGVLAAAVVLTATLPNGSALAGSGSTPPRPIQPRNWADEVSESIGSGAGSTRNAGRTGEIGGGASPGGSGGGGASGSGGGGGAAEKDGDPGRGDGQGRGSDRGQGSDR